MKDILITMYFRKGIAYENRRKNIGELSEADHGLYSSITDTSIMDIFAKDCQPLSDPKYYSITSPVQLNEINEKIFESKRFIKMLLMNLTPLNGTPPHQEDKTK